MNHSDRNNIISRGELIIFLPKQMGLKNRIHLDKSSKFKILQLQTELTNAEMKLLNQALSFYILYMKN